MAEARSHNSSWRALAPTRRPNNRNSYANRARRDETGRNGELRGRTKTRVTSAISNQPDEKQQ